MTLGGSNLGGGINGISPKQTVLNYKDGDQALIRKQLRTAWNTSYARGTVNGKKRAIGPFRAVMNSGDFLSRQNYVCGGPSPNHLYRGGIFQRFGSTISQCDNTGIPPSATNTKFVADSSDYTRFKKQNAMNHNYNDNSFGGSTNSEYTAIMHVRR